MKAGFAIISTVYWGAMLLYSVLVLGALGFGGAGCPVQTGFSNWRSIYNITYLQDFLLSMVGGYIGCLFILTVAMLVSAKCHSTVIAVTIPFVLSCAPMFLGRIALFSRLMTLFPDQLLRINKSLEDIKLYVVGGKVMGFLAIIVPLYFVLCCAAAPVLYGVYRRAEVK